MGESVLYLGSRYHSDANMCSQQKEIYFSRDTRDKGSSMMWILRRFNYPPNSLRPPHIQCAMVEDVKMSFTFACLYMLSHTFNKYNKRHKSNTRRLCESKRKQLLVACNNYPLVVAYLGGARRGRESGVVEQMLFSRETYIIMENIRIHTTTPMDACESFSWQILRLMKSPQTTHNQQAWHVVKKVQASSLELHGWSHGENKYGGGKCT